MQNYVLHAPVRGAPDFLRAPGCPGAPRTPGRPAAPRILITLGTKTGHFHMEIVKKRTHVLLMFFS